MLGVIFQPLTWALLTEGRSVSISGRQLQRDGLNAGRHFLDAGHRGTVCILGLTLLQTASTESRVSVEQMFCKIYFNHL